MTTNERVAEIVTQVLSIDQTVNRKLFEVDLEILGLDSLTMVRIFMQLERDLGIEFPNEALTFDNFRTIEQIAQIVDSLKGN